MASKDPLGLPKGSVRSILALLLTTSAVLTGLGALAYGLATDKISDPTAIVLAVLALSQMAVGFYFITRPPNQQ